MLACACSRSACRVLSEFVNVALLVCSAESSACFVASCRPLSHCKYPAIRMTTPTAAKAQRVTRCERAVRACATALIVWAAFISATCASSRASAASLCLRSASSRADDNEINSLISSVVMSPGSPSRPRARSSWRPAGSSMSSRRPFCSHSALACSTAARARSFSRLASIQSRSRFQVRISASCATSTVGRLARSNPVTNSRVRGLANCSMILIWSASMGIAARARVSSWPSPGVTKRRNSCRATC